jgi:hypothetical protein
MSIFRETFPQFIVDELNRRQTGMLTRTPAFLQQLNTRSAWVRMTSGVNTVDGKGQVTNELARKYVLQGGTLLDNTNLRAGLGGSGTATYDRLSPGGTSQRLGIRPMPGITGVNVQSKGAYGSLQEATVSFVVWDIRQLEELELLYMRPGYTVLLEFGWDYVKPTPPKYDILNRSNISLNDAFAEIYELIRKSGGNYDALLGYVKNYNWSARDDGGYDCTTTIISLGEVLESLKCNWIPMETLAFTKTGLLGYGLEAGNEGISESYERGIIPGLLHELFYYLDNPKYSKPNEGISYSRKLYDSRIGKTYDLFMSKRLGKDIDKIDRGGLSKPIGGTRVEGYITLASFCDLINGYVLLKDINNKSISQITINETNNEGNIIDGSLLKCIASPLSLSTNYGICFVRNDNWKNLGITVVKEEAATDENLTGDTAIVNISPDVREAIGRKNLIPIGTKRITERITQIGDIDTYPGNLRVDLEQISRELLNNIENIEVTKDDLKIKITFFDGNSFISTASKPSEFVNFFDYFNKTRLEQIRIRGGGTQEATNTPTEQLDLLYSDLFGEFQYVGKEIYDNTGKRWTPNEIKTLIKNTFSKQILSTKLQEQVNNQTAIVTSAISEVASNVPGFSSGTLQFLVPDSSASTKSLGYIGNIYVNINFLYSQAISKNVASTDIQNKNTISIREYLQGILREIQNSLGNINNFDIQVDNRNAIGRIIDINYTGDPAINAFVLQIHNLNSVVRNYTFQSKIFPEMGSIIAISAQDATGVGKLGYDNATLVAWNEGIKDRLIPKRDFNRDISLSNTSDPTSFIFPFLSKIYTYFQALDGTGTNNKNLSYGGLDFAYRDFLANLTRFDPQNRFAAIIPTELSVTLDGIGGIVIGNIFKINQDIIPKGYKGTGNREIAYIVVKLGHSIQDNDWVTELSAYPIVLQKPQSTEVWKKWKNQKYPNSTIVLTNPDGSPIVPPPALDAYIPKNSNIPVIKYLAGKGYQNGQIPSNELRYLKITTDSESNTIHQLYPTAASQWEKLIAAARSAGFSIKDTQISLIPGAAYRPLSQQQEGVGRAPIGTSVHGWGAAVDIQSLIDYQRSFTNIPKGNPPAGAEAAANVRAGSKLYQWLNTNAATYGWINPPKLKDGSGADEAWHWEYWGPVSGGTIGASEVQAASQPVVTVETVIAALKDATGGILGAFTNEAALEDAINRIPDRAFFLQVNSKLNIENLLNAELGISDVRLLSRLKTRLASIGVTLNYEIVRGIVQDSIKVTIK